MKFVICVYPSDNRITAPVGFGVVENSGEDLEEAAKGEVTISGVTVQASLSLTPAPAPVDSDQLELYKED